MDDVVKAQAVIRPAQNISSVRAMTTAQVSELHCAQNGIVHKGDVLVVFEASSVQKEASLLRTQIAQFQSEIKEADLVLESMKLLQNCSEPQTMGYAKSAAYLAEYARQTNEVEQLHAAVQKEQSMPTTLYVQATVDQCRAKEQQARLAFVAWQNSQRLSVQSGQERSRNEMQNALTRLAAVEESVRNACILAPIDGTVDMLVQLNTGDFVFSGTELLRIIPSGETSLKAEIVLDAAHIARVKNNQEAKLRFPGLPPSQFGQATARISLIPADMSVVDNAPVFAVEADIVDSFLQASTGEKIALRPGLSAEARIIVARDSVFKMLLRKLDFVH